MKHAPLRIAAMAVGALALALLWWTQRESTPVSPAAANDVPQYAPWLYWLYSDRTTATPTATAAAGETARTSEPPKGEATADTIEVCGRGRLHEKALDGVIAPDSVAMRKHVDQLTRSGDDRQRALALVFRAKVDERLASSRAVREHGDGRGNCVTPACSAALATARERAVATDLTALVRLASDTRDATVYRIAFTACQSTRAAACQTISAARWAQLEPDNGVPWIYLAAEAQQRGDRIGRDLALHRLTQTPRLDAGDRDFAAMGYALSQRARDAADWLNSAAWTVYPVAMVPLPPYHVAREACRGDPMLDVNHRELCTRVADTLVERDRSVIGYLVGVGIGTGAGWAPERSAALDDESEAVRHALGGGRALPNYGQLDCASVERLRDLTRVLHETGELAHVREWIKSSGQSVAELAAESRARKAAAARQPAEAANASPKSNPK